MATFPSITPSYGFTKNSAPIVNRAQYGSGYSQRTVFGINQDLKTLNLQWNNITEANSDTIETFLEARGGSESFDYTATGESSSSKYICTTWSKQINYTGRATITATFEQVAKA